MLIEQRYSYIFLNVKSIMQEFSPSLLGDHEPESKRERRLKEKINQIEEEILELKYKEQVNQSLHILVYILILFYRHSQTFMSFFLRFTLEFAVLTLFFLFLYHEIILKYTIILFQHIPSQLFNYQLKVELSSLYVYHNITSTLLQHDFDNVYTFSYYYTKEQ